MSAPKPKSNGQFRERRALTGRAEVLRAALRSAGAMKPRLDATYLVKGWLDRGTFSALYGASGSGKTFLAADMALHVAARARWHGSRVRADGTVIYVAAEGSGGLENRCLAWAKENPTLWGEAAAHFYALASSIDLHGSNDAAELVKATADLRPCLIVVDTLARAMGAGDENTAKDMGVVAMNVGEIIAETGAHVLLVHHTGKDATKGARGSSSLRGAVDTEISIVREGGVITATAEKQRERPGGETRSYRLRSVELGVDEDGDPVTSCVVEPLAQEEADGRKANAVESRLSGQQRDGLEALRDAAAAHGRRVMGSPDFPSSRPIVAEDAWRDEFYRRSAGEPDAKRKGFQRVREALKEKRLVGHYDGQWWTVQSSGTGGT